MPTVLLVRHGQASFGAADYDVLSELGRRQADIVAASLADRGYRAARLYSGTLRRQQETAAAFGAVGAPALEVEPRWDEFDPDDVLTHHSESALRIQGRDRRDADQPRLPGGARTGAGRVGRPRRAQPDVADLAPVQRRRDCRAGGAGDRSRLRRDSGRRHLGRRDRRRRRRPARRPGRGLRRPQPHPRQRRRHQDRDRRDRHQRPHASTTTPTWSWSGASSSPTAEAATALGGVDHADRAGDGAAVDQVLGRR